MTSRKPVASEIAMQGIGVSPGIVIARALLVEPGGTFKKRRISADGSLALEQSRFRNAVARTEDKLRQVREQFAAVMADYATIIDTHILMLRDRMIFDRTLEIIAAEKINAEWALDKALGQVEAAFAKVDDTYISGRFLDVRQVADRIFCELSGTEMLPEEIDGKLILVARDFSPEDILHMSDRAGFLAEMGGETSHSAIVAKTLGIPAVLGLKDVNGRISTNDLIILDGVTGLVFVNPQEELLEYYQDRQRQYQQLHLEVAQYAHLRAETSDGLQVRVEANLEIADEVGQAFAYGAGGIGLFRSEYLYLSALDNPSEELLFATYKDLLSAAAPFPVTIRTFDIGGDKQFMAKAGKSSGFRSKMEKQWSSEANPALGLRAIRYCLHEPVMFATQLRALLRASSFGCLRILFPMISSYCELQQVKEVVAGVQEKLRSDGIPFAERVELGLMIEVPSAVAVADTLAREVDFFSIGTNDLIQYSLAIDRGNEQVAHMYEPLHPAILRMISQVVEAAHRAGIEVGICGEMAGEEKYLPLLLGLGVDSFSMHPPAIPYIKRMIRQSRAASVERLARRLLACSSSTEIRELLQHYLARHYPDSFPVDNHFHSD
ncbi:MAG: phosphoenolpyruvate--protein phosphotransferase [Proteobacteria bacterium]|nr:phosphoenolpyruvate--protein phosphotransferase [Pseudomonadota bacterium]MBU4296192.1 phosphoenolpyruvate--protein phosphotransferase [Pseudomonadota bacterium]MCG2749654.1 phosphoenolpyruvate--protein phosphotransferase [Desulfobulbaceae bacterium]